MKTGCLDLQHETLPEYRQLCYMYKQGYDACTNCIVETQHHIVSKAVSITLSSCVWPLIHTFFLKHESQALRLRLLYRVADFGSLGISNTQKKEFELNNYYH